ncbi:MAG: AAA family ATPase, partial [Candidatus Sabulitectum sp.]|nr:AAA family ATPase [Candidatus Sabulitectum sp.]
MNEELGLVLKNAFLARKKQSISSDLNKAMLVPGERRDVAVLFLDLSGFTAFSESLDHETVHNITKSLMDELVFTAEQYSGYVDKIEGDRIMVLFGAIRSTENNSRSSILCGFKMLEVVEIAGSVLKSIGVRLSARIGINNGPVTVAPDAIGHLTAMGNTVNIASRMEENAEENSILVADSVYANCSENIQWSKPAELTVKGITVPVCVWKPVAVGYKSNPAFCTASVRTVFVAREKEYSILAQVRRMQLDRGSGKNRMGGARHLIVELTGEAGTGKTRLVSEFLKNESLESEAIILRGYSIPDAQPAHWLWSAVLQSLLNLQIENSISYKDFVDSISRCCHSKDLKGALPFLGRLVSASSDHIDLTEMGNKAIATETRMAVRDLIESLSEASPVIVVLEDLQWMDSTDAEVLDFIVKNCYSVYPVIFLLIRRSDHKNLLPDDICKSSAYALCNQISLGELTIYGATDFTERFLQRLRGAEYSPVSAKAMEFINRHSSGNPFFLQELILHLVESGGLSIVNDIWVLAHSSVELSTPVSLTGLLQSRLDRLPDILRKTLLNCSVFGLEFRYDTYKSVELKLDIKSSGEDVFNRLVERQFLEKTASDQGISFVFHHSFIQST